MRYISFLSVLAALYVQQVSCVASQSPHSYWYWVKINIATTGPNFKFLSLSANISAPTKAPGNSVIRAGLQHGTGGGELQAILSGGGGNEFQFGAAWVGEQPALPLHSGFSVQSKQIVGVDMNLVGQFWDTTLRRNVGQAESAPAKEENKQSSFAIGEKPMAQAIFAVQLESRWDPKTFGPVVFSSIWLEANIPTTEWCKLQEGGPGVKYTVKGVQTFPDGKSDGANSFCQIEEITLHGPKTPK